MVDDRSAPSVVHPTRASFLRMVTGALAALFVPWRTVDAAAPIPVAAPDLVLIWQQPVVLCGPNGETWDQGRIVTARMDTSTGRVWTDSQPEWEANYGKTIHATHVVFPGFGDKVGGTGDLKIAMTRAQHILDGNSLVLMWDGPFAEVRPS